jgi:hypothetical protein
MCLSRVRSVVLVGLIACATPAKLARPVVIVLGDATVAAPPRWYVEQRADRVTFMDPDRTLHVTIVANAGADTTTAIATAWQLAEPGFALTPGEPEEMPDSGDWDAVTTIEYRPPTSEHRAVIARWRTSGTHRFVVLVDGDRAASATPAGAELDAGEWRVAIDQEVEPDGTVKLVVLDPPFAGSAWVVGPGPSLLIPGYPGYGFARKQPS